MQSLKLPPESGEQGPLTYDRFDTSPLNILHAPRWLACSQASTIHPAGILIDDMQSLKLPPESGEHGPFTNEKFGTSCVSVRHAPPRSECSQTTTSCAYASPVKSQAPKPSTSVKMYRAPRWVISTSLGSGFTARVELRVAFREMKIRSHYPPPPKSRRVPLLGEHARVTRFLYHSGVKPDPT